jgi:hypothetical protein
MIRFGLCQIRLQLITEFKIVSRPEWANIAGNISPIDG